MNFKILLLQSIMAMFLLNSCSNEKPTQPAETYYGYVYVVTQPDSAEIFINNISTKRFTQDTLKIPIGQQKITLKKIGYFDTTFTVSVIKDEYLFKSITMRPGLPGNIYLSSNPSDAYIYIDGVYLSKNTPNQISGLLPKTILSLLKR